MMSCAAASFSNNAMQWDATEPSRNVFSFNRGDQLVALAKASGAKVRCHALCWVRSLFAVENKHNHLTLLAPIL